MLIIVLVNVINYLFAQANSIDNKNLYIRAISAIIDTLPKEYGNIKPDKDLKSLIFQKNTELLDSLPKQLNGASISYLTIEELKEITKRKNNRIPIIVIRPIMNDQNLIKISFIDYWLDFSRFRKKIGRKTLNFALVGGHNVYFKYDCSKNDFVVCRIDYLCI